MSCVDIREQFLSYADCNGHQSSYWNQPAFMKSCNEALLELETLRVKVKQLEQSISKNRLSRDPKQESKMLANIKDNIKVCENHLKRISLMAPDMKTSSRKFLEEYKSSIVATLEMKLLEIGLKFKQIFQARRNAEQSKSSSQNTNNGAAPNISRSLFLEQSQEEVMDEIAANEYRDIEKSISQISEMYKQTLSVVRLHEFMIDNITSNIDEAEGHVEEGRKHLTDAHRRVSKNQSLIYKVFFSLYALTFIYIVILN